MCGIVAVLRRRAERTPPASASVLEPLDRALAFLAGPGDLAARASRAAAAVAEADALLRGIPGVTALLSDLALSPGIVARLDRIDAAMGELDAALEATAGDIEAANGALVVLRDAVWAVGHDRVRNAAAIDRLIGGRVATISTIEAFTSVQIAFSALDRLEVRGRDSAGLHVHVAGHGLDLDDPAIARLLSGRTDDALFRSKAVCTPEGDLAFVYKAAAEIGELGDNTSALRAAVMNDALLHLAVRADTARSVVLAHTRWASVGIISEANAHPLNEEEIVAFGGPYVVAALNGDVDNHADLKAAHGLRIPSEITTDAKVIPALVSHNMMIAPDLAEAFRRTVASFEGSVAIGAYSGADPDRVALALRGSGQALYVGLAEDCFVVASEPYGLVEETTTYLRMDGETPARPEQPSSSRGQVVLLDAAHAGELLGIERFGYDATPLPVSEAEFVTAEITTRDIDRGEAPHFLLKEITEAPESLRKTLRGRIRENDGVLSADVGARALPVVVADNFRSGAIKRVIVIGQGTAAIAGRALAALLSELAGHKSLRVDAMVATELSGFGMDHDMSDTLIVAVSQSGTTTDTNRTVDLVRGRGATVIAIVNRRNSDLTDKADGVLYTSDGRDVEMSVASTKAFYAQVAAGALLACALAELVDPAGTAPRHELLVALRTLPEALADVMGSRADIARVAQSLAPSRRHWALVGNGMNAIAAAELRIKMSELCYKSIACDITEDKKHIDLSSEPLIIVCAAGLVGSTADDVAKEVAIFRAHKAAPIVIATEGDERFSAALAVLTVPSLPGPLSFVLATMVGHLFGYEAALAIDAQARLLREGRGVVEAAVTDESSADVALARVQATISPVAQRIVEGIRSGAFNGHLEASTAAAMLGSLRYATGVAPLDSYPFEFGRMGTPDVVLNDLTAALTRGIEELTRPIDAIKHQAKTVTVGISRSDEALLANRLVKEVLAAGTPRDRLSYRMLKVLADLEPAIASVNGYVRYRIQGDPSSDDATIEIIDRGGIARDLASRTERNRALRGTKRRAALEREITCARGRHDGRTLLLVPEVRTGSTTGITLLHVGFADRLPAEVLRGVLGGYRGRYEALRDFVTETEPAFRDDLMATMPVVDLLTSPINDLADRWRAP
ncbi:MAG: SIS domain-containing protein [Acidimicrobiales bacterium]